MTAPQTHILVVDDERNIRKNLKLVLEAAGYAVDVASDGDEAAVMCRQMQYAIALVDVQMPKVNGLELLALMRSVSPDTAVVMLTAYGTVGRAVQAMKLGAVDFQEKPFDPKALVLLLEEILLRKGLGARAAVDELLHLAELARERGANLEARAYLKSALLRDPARPEPYYGLGELWEREADVRQAVQYYLMAIEAHHTFEPARTALTRLGYSQSAPPE